VEPLQDSAQARLLALATHILLRVELTDHDSDKRTSLVRLVIG